MSFNRWFLFMLVPVLLLSAASASWAQPSQQQYVVIYVEFKAEDANRGKKLVDDLARQSLQSSGVINFSTMREPSRPNRFALVERWTSPQTYQAYKASSTWLSFVSQALPMLQAPLDERDGFLLE